MLQPRMIILGKLGEIMKEGGFVGFSQKMEF